MRAYDCITRDHLGLIDTLNFGLAEARGCYLARLDSDDLCAPTRLEVQVGLLEDRPEIVLVGSAYTVINQQGAPIQINYMPQTDVAIRWHALFHSPFAHSSVMLRLNVLQKNGLAYDPAMQEAEDYLLWSQLLHHGQACNFPEPLVQYRQHPGQASQLGQPAVREFAGRVSQKNLADLGVHLPLDQIQRLREWYYHFPPRFERDDLDLSLTLIDILDRFSAQPGLDPKEVQRIRGRWLGRLLRASLFNNKALDFKNFAFRIPTWMISWQSSPIGLSGKNQPCHRILLSTKARKNRTMSLHISVCIYTFNRAKLLAQALESVCNQTLPSEALRSGCRR